jgi:hypothetical protein
MGIDHSWASIHNIYIKRLERFPFRSLGKGRTDQGGGKDDLQKSLRDVNREAEPGHNGTHKKAGRQCSSVVSCQHSSQP